MAKQWQICGGIDKKGGAMLTAQHVEAVLRAIPGAYGNQRATLAVLADGANEALASAPAGLTVQGAAAFLATMSQESGSFRYLEEIRKNGRYAPYIGRTFEQITWRDNYATFGAWCVSRGLLTDADTFVKTPKSLADIRWAWLGGVWFWQKNGIWAYGNKGDFLATQRAVNLGNPHSTATPNGIAARRAWYAAWLKIGADLLPTTATPATPDPEESNVAKVKFRGGWTCSCVATSLPLVEQDMIRRGLIKQSVDIYQLGYRSDVSASAGTHDGGGNTDVAQFSDKQIDVWRLWGWTIQHRTKAQGFDMDHGHGWPLGCTHLSSGGRAQAAQWANRQNGLVSKGRVSGRWPIDTWKTAMKKRLAEIAKAEHEQELELPTTAEVVKALTTDKAFLEAVGEAAANADVVPNEFTTNAANEFVATKTALVYLSRQNKALSDKLDALIARFPSTTA